MIYCFLHYGTGGGGRMSIALAAECEKHWRPIIDFYKILASFFVCSANWQLEILSLQNW